MKTIGRIRRGSLGGDGGSVVMAPKTCDLGRSVGVAEGVLVLVGDGVKLDGVGVSVSVCVGVIEEVGLGVEVGMLVGASGTLTTTT